MNFQEERPLSLHYGKGHSNTTRSKSYKKGCPALNCNRLNQILSLDIAKRRIHVEPRVTMEELAKATLMHGLLPAVIPEFKGITVGGAIMGAAAESSSHKWGIFHDCCTKIELIDGKGDLIQASPAENADIFYGISGSYGSLGLLVSVEMELIPVQHTVNLRYHYFANPQEALQKMQELCGLCDFLDGIIFAQDQAVIIEANMTSEPAKQPSSMWYAHKVKENVAEKTMPLFDYLFRYDQGAFWMGAFLFSVPFLTRYVGQGLLKLWPSNGWFKENEISLFKNLPFPGTLACHLTRPMMSSQPLWKLLHKAEKWIQDRLIIQDFCIPQEYAARFLADILKNPGTFPLWLCPIKGTATPQVFAPHLGRPLFFNFGMYGAPGYSAPMEQIMKELEYKTLLHKGRKVLYSRSYYTSKMFWEIYSKESYETLRKKTHAGGTWRELTEKVLSE